MANVIKRPFQHLKREFTAEEAAAFLSQELGGFPIGISEIYLLTSSDLLPARYMFEGGFLVDISGVKNPYDAQSFLHRHHLPNDISDSCSLLNAKNELTCFISGSYVEPNIGLELDSTSEDELSERESDKDLPWGFLTEHLLSYSGTFPLVVNNVTAKYLWLLAREKYIGPIKEGAPPVCVGSIYGANHYNMYDEDFSGNVVEGGHFFLCKYFEISGSNLEKQKNGVSSTASVNVLEFEPKRLIFDFGDLNWFVENWKTDEENGFAAILADYSDLDSHLVGRKNDWELVRGEGNSGHSPSRSTKTDNNQSKLLALLAVALAGEPSRTKTGAYAGKKTYDQIIGSILASLRNEKTCNKKLAGDLLDAMPEEKTFRRYLDDGLKRLSII